MKRGGQIASPESLLSTFFHEYGHTNYLVEHHDKEDEVASETEAIRFSLQALENEGYPNLAYREAESVKGMAGATPYKEAVANLKSDPLWQSILGRPTKSRGPQEVS
jgi:hypothetical protein